MHMNKRLLKISSTFLLLVMLLSGEGHSKDLGIKGTVYPIIERDALEEIEEQANRVDWGKLFDKKANDRRIKNYKPSNIVHLSRSKINRVRTVNISYALEFDIPDGKGGILYPKGFLFNPLDYLLYPNTIVVINGADREQVEWFKHSAHFDSSTCVLWITDGNYYDLSGELGRPVYYANDFIVRRFELQFVPCLIVQKGNRLEVTEIDVESYSKKHHS